MSTPAQKKRLSIHGLDFDADSDGSTQSSGHPPYLSPVPMATDSLQVSGLSFLPPSFPATRGPGEVGGGGHSGKESDDHSQYQSTTGQGRVGEGAQGLCRDGAGSLGKWSAGWELRLDR